MGQAKQLCRRCSKPDMLSQPSLDGEGKVSQSKLMVLDHCQANANTRQAPSRCQLGNPPASSQCSCWDSHGRSTVGKLCNTTWLRVRVPQGLTLQLHPESIARSGKSIAMEGADTWTRGTVGEHTTDFSLCPIRLAFSLVPQQCLVFTALGNICSLHSFQWSVGKALTRNKKTREFAFKSILLTLFLSK